MIRLEKITETMLDAILAMKLSEEQKQFVAPNVVSLAQAWLCRESARPFAICEGDEPVGFVMLDWNEGKRAVGVWRFMIAMQHQRKGYGRAALKEVIRLVRENGGIDMLYLDYVPGNHVARELYASLGFRETGEEVCGEIIMRLPLTDQPHMGACRAVSDDINEITELIENEKRLGHIIPDGLADEDARAKWIADGALTCLCVMRKTVGVALGAAYIIRHEYQSFQPEAERLLGDRQRDIRCVCAPRVCLRGECENAVRLYQNALGARVERILYAHRGEGEPDRVCRADLCVGGQRVVLYDDMVAADTPRTDISLNIAFHSQADMAHAAGCLAPDTPLTDGANEMDLFDRYGLRWHLTWPIADGAYACESN